MATKSAKKLANRIFEEVEGVPGLTKVTQRVISLLERDDSTVEQVERALRGDHTLATQVLRYANARYFDHEKQIGSLEKAIQLLGFNTLRSIAILQGMDRKYTTPEHPSFPREEFWQYSMATGLCAEIIADRLGYDSRRKGEVFSAGQIHGVGKTIIDQYLHDEFEQILELVERNGKSMYEAEQECLGMTHCEIGAEVFRKWSLPDHLVETVRNYYDPPRDSSDNVRIVHLATVLAKTKHYGYSGDENIGYLREECVDRLGLTGDELEQILQKELPRRYDEFKDVFES